MYIAEESFSHWCQKKKKKKKRFDHYIRVKRDWPALKKRSLSFLGSSYISLQLSPGVLSARFRVTIHCAWRAREDGCPRQGSRDWLPQSIIRVCILMRARNERTLTGQWNYTVTKIDAVVIDDWWYARHWGGRRWFSPDHWPFRRICSTIVTICIPCYISWHTAHWILQSASLSKMTLISHAIK